MDWRTKSKLKIFLYALVPIALGVLSAFLIFDYSGYEKLPSNNKIITEVNAEYNKNKEPEKPKYYYFRKELIVQPKISAEAYLVGDLETGEVILAKNEESRFPIASVSKLMTALVANENIATEDTVKISRTALSTYGENGGFYAGEKIKVKDLFYPLLLESSNDAAEAIAEFFGRDVFLDQMNTYAKRLKMINTSYKDPSGLSPYNLSTVSDLFKLAGHINQKEGELLSITKNRSYTNKKHIWFSNNQFLRESGYIGGKSGYTDPAKQTVISIFSLPLGENISRTIGIVLLRSNDRYQDVEKILSYLKKNIYYGGASEANADWIKEKLDIPDINDNYVRLTFLGDIMLDRGVRSSVTKNFSSDYSMLFEKMEALKDSDIVFANLEGPASDKGADMKSLYSFRMNPSTLPALKGGGIDIVSVANNHVGDWGREAYIDTLTRLKENEIAYAGGGLNRIEAETPTIIEQNGIKIGFLGFSDVGPNWMAVSDNDAGLLLASNPRFEEIIKNASLLVDQLVVSFHWGDEYKDIHNARQEYLAHKAIENGAKLVIGHHPHVTQDEEVYKNGYIIYSLGNFIFDQAFSAKTMQGTMLEVELSKDGFITKRKNTVKLSKFFQPTEIIKGKQEIVKFQGLE